MMAETQQFSFYMARTTLMAQMQANLNSHLPTLPSPASGTAHRWNDVQRDAQFWQGTGGSEVQQGECMRTHLQHTADAATAARPCPGVLVELLSVKLLYCFANAVLGVSDDALKSCLLPALHLGWLDVASLCLSFFLSSCDCDLSHICRGQA